MFATTLLLWVFSVTLCHGFLSPAMLDQRGCGPTRRFLTQPDGIGVGIDLVGTTNSAIAFLDCDSPPEIIEMPNNGWTMKSVVAFDEFGKPLVGNEALQWERKMRIGASRHVKRVIGTGVNSLSKVVGQIHPVFSLEVGAGWGGWGGIIGSSSLGCGCWVVGRGSIVIGLICCRRKGSVWLPCGFDRSYLLRLAKQSKL
jgi:hypothetical protein